MDPSIEIRKLPASVIKELVNALEFGEYWKRLMAIIPKSLEKNNYECKITLHNLPKYKSEHFRLIENESERSHRSCTEILLDEWGTSGRIRPALGHLLYLLIKAEVFRAADYIAVELLHQDPPERPKNGPAAFVADFQELKKPQPQNVEQILDQITYSSSLISNVNVNTIDANIDPGSDSRNVNSKPKVLVIPEIVISESQDDHGSTFNVPLVISRGRGSRDYSDSNNENAPSVGSNRDGNGAVSNEEYVPAISKLLVAGEKSDNVASTLDESTPSTDLSTTSQSVESITNTPNSDMIKFSSEINITDSKLPNLTLLQINESECNTSDTETRTNYMPAISELMYSSGNNVPNLSALYANGCDSNNTSQVQSDTYLPVLSALNAVCENSDRRSTLNNNFVSPLPNLSLNTSLKHFSYFELDLATNHFDRTPYIHGEDGLNGRFLGSGGFGSVFLALNLLDKPVAVKKLNLNNPDVDVTKQFKNEVEVLCKYKHENLVSLIGYSCDGLTYCLVYEYISGGTLKDKLQNQKHQLPWQSRLHIALDTAKAVTYLHTAFSTPLIHRDIKSANILLDGYNKPKLCDFGLIKITHNQHTTVSTRASGTSDYMAPEAHRGDVSVKTDAFSFGVVLLELLTALPVCDPNRKEGHLITYVEENCDEDIGSLLDKSAGSWISSEDKDCGKALFQIATKCLKEKKHRPEMVNVTQLLEELVHNL